jgi:uncharacterized protein (UPF0262 family)
MGDDNPDVAQERKLAIYELLEDSYFKLDGGASGPYKLHISLADNRLVFHVNTPSATKPAIFILSLSPFRKLVKDYFLVCESYYNAIRNAPTDKIEAMDMGRRGLHDEGASLLQERLAGKVTIDMQTARRLFTLICAMRR